MKSKLFLCAALAAALYVTPSYAADYSAQVVSFSQEDPDNLSIELTGSKVIKMCIRDRLIPAPPVTARRS